MELDEFSLVDLTPLASLPVPPIPLEMAEREGEHIPGVHGPEAFFASWDGTDHEPRTYYFRGADSLEGDFTIGAEPGAPPLPDAARWAILADWIGSDWSGRMAEGRSDEGTTPDGVAYVWLHTAEAGRGFTPYRPHPVLGRLVDPDAGAR